MKQASNKQAAVTTRVRSAGLLEEQPFFSLLVAYVLLAKYMCIRGVDKCVLGSLIDQHVSAAVLSLINNLDNMVNNWHF